MQQVKKYIYVNIAIIFLYIVSCYSSMVLPIDEKNITYTRIYYTSNKKPTTKLSSSSKTFARNLSSLRSRPAPNNTQQTKLWRKGRFTRKQYEIINMLWRKTNVYVDVEAATTPKQKQNNFAKTIFDLDEESDSFIFSPGSQNIQTSTPSYIEFYYSDETNDRVTKTDCGDEKCHHKADKFNADLRTHNSSFVIFRIKPMPRPVEARTSINNSKSNFYPGKVEQIKTSAKRCLPDSTKQPTTYEYDKIKFFELYDKLTQTPLSIKNNISYNNNNDNFESSEINYDHMTMKLGDQRSHAHKKPRHSRKHITANYNNQAAPCLNSNEARIKPKPYLMNVVTEVQNKTNSYTTSISPLKLTSKQYKTAYSYTNKSVSWSEYPYVAVYVYEPLQVHCDAVSISAHWLIASGSCLSRLNKSPMFGEGRSAFVAYCGDNWWMPERVSYVKFSGVHPWYHPRNRMRKHLYNIGVIQVVTSMMSACSEWAPVSLMSHQFTANRGGSEALALGWGLDRFDTRYTTTDLPKMSLMIYKGLVFSDSCPGNSGYGKMKQLDDGGGVSNVYCLSLPPYSGEERDPVHGSLLLIGGKLMGLYLQEERRPSGEQSAQYTGIWRLIPWVMETAKEPLETESVEI